MSAITRDLITTTGVYPVLPEMQYPLPVFPSEPSFTPFTAKSMMSLPFVGICQTDNLSEEQAKLKRLIHNNLDVIFRNLLEHLVEIVRNHKDLLSHLQKANKVKKLDMDQLVHLVTEWMEKKQVKPAKEDLEEFTWIASPYENLKTILDDLPVALSAAQSFKDIGKMNGIIEKSIEDFNAPLPGITVAGVACTSVKVLWSSAKGLYFIWDEVRKNAVLGAVVSLVLFGPFTPQALQYVFEKLILKK